MKVTLVIHCAKNGAHLIDLDDMVITNWHAVLADPQCPDTTTALVTIMDEILKWRANWRPQPTHDEFQEIHDRLSRTPAIFRT